MKFKDAVKELSSSWGWVLNFQIKSLGFGNPRSAYFHWWKLSFEHDLTELWNCLSGCGGKYSCLQIHALRITCRGVFSWRQDDLLSIYTIINQGILCWILCKTHPGSSIYRQTREDEGELSSFGERRTETLEIKWLAVNQTGNLWQSRE